MPRTIVILQSNYLPWRGYFDLMRQADNVVLFDSVQYTRRDWRNRNLIKTATGPRWITMAVDVKGKYHQSIDETRIAEPHWTTSHLQEIENCYRKAVAFDETMPWLREQFRAVAGEMLLTRVNEHLLTAIAARLGLAVTMRRCVDILDRAAMRAMQPTERLVALCRALGGERYLSGPAARAYLDERAFAAAGIDVAWASYDGYRDYPQLWGAFEPRVSVIDLLLNTGSAARGYIGAG